jgi:hypothetical protein
LSRLRVDLTEQAISDLKAHLAETYQTFLESRRFELRVDGESLAPSRFDHWAYPPGFQPRHYTGNMTTPEGDQVVFDAVVGLMRESSATGDWGLYLYCNDRLVVRRYTDPSIGFVTGLIGKPHPDISLVRAEVRLSGPVRAMPWNSTKSDLKLEHPVFRSLRTWITPVLTDWASLSRRTSGEWKTAIFRYDTGEFDDQEVDSFTDPGHSYLPPLPVSRPQYPDRVQSANSTLTDRKPWVKDLYEMMTTIDFIERRDLGARNRALLILLDSNLEIAFKEYLVNESGTNFSDAKLTELFNSRHQLEIEIRRHVDLGGETWTKIGYFHLMRNKLTHQQASLEVTDDTIQQYRRLVEGVLRVLFGLKLRV